MAQTEEKVAAAVGRDIGEVDTPGNWAARAAGQVDVAVAGEAGKGGWACRVGESVVDKG